MLKVFLEVYNDLKTFIAIDKDLPTKLLMIDEELIKEVTKILEIFDKSTLILSENSCPTIQLVVQIKRRIISKLKIDDKDSDSIKAFKQISKFNVEKYMKTHLIHNLALFFDPKCKDLKLLNETEKEEVMNVLVENMKSLSIKNQPESVQ
jgi:hypothetical protein